MQTEEYLKKDLKRGVDYIGVTVVFVCHDKDGRVLLHKRSQNCRDEQGRWDCGAGAMEFGESSFEEAVRREVIEEYCVDPTKIVHAGTTNVIREHIGKTTHWIAVLFSVYLDDPSAAKIGEPDKMDKIGWFHTHELPDPLHSQFHNHYEMIKKYF